MSRIAKIIPKFTPVKFFYVSYEQQIEEYEWATHIFMIQAENVQQALELLQPHLPAPAIGKTTIMEVKIAPHSVVKMGEIHGGPY